MSLGTLGYATWSWQSMANGYLSLWIPAGDCLSPSIELVSSLLGDGLEWQRALSLIVLNLSAVDDSTISQVLYRGGISHQQFHLPCAWSGGSQLSDTSVRSAELLVRACPEVSSNQSYVTVRLTDTGVCIAVVYQRVRSAEFLVRACPEVRSSQ